MRSLKFPLGIFDRSPSPDSVLRPDPVFIVGMHRSGTLGAWRGALEGLGLSIGKTLMPPDVEGNPKGHFENLAVAELHGRFLSDLDRDWMDPGCLGPELLAGKAARKFRKRLPSCWSGNLATNGP